MVLKSVWVYHVTVTVIVAVKVRCSCLPVLYRIVVVTIFTVKHLPWSRFCSTVAGLENVSPVFSCHY